LARVAQHVEHISVEVVPAQEQIERSGPGQVHRRRGVGVQGHDVLGGRPERAVTGVELDADEARVEVIGG
jgi:hypothetical protein